MKQVIISIIFIVASTFCIAQRNVFKGTNNTPLETSAQQTSDINPASYHLIVEEIRNAAGFESDFVLKEAKVDNIEASIFHRKKYILYNPEFMKWIDNVTKDKWATVALLAHEIGHHEKGHTKKKSKRKRLQFELEADEFAGYVLNKMGASLEQAQIVMKYIARTTPSHTHPARNDRMNAIHKGWNTANTDSAINETVSTSLF